MKQELLRRASEGDHAAEEAVLAENTALVWSIVRRFSDRGIDADDLFQLGCVGCIKAIRGFDFTYGTQFSTYAVPKIAGEIRRFLRDDGNVKVSRVLRERASKVGTVRQELCMKLGREPSLTEIGATLGLSVYEVAEAELSCADVSSLQAETEEGVALEDTLCTEWSEEELVESIELREQIRQLPNVERKVILLRFYRGFTQERCARILCVSQVQVSRLEKRALATLRHHLLSE